MNYTDEYTVSDSCIPEPRRITNYSIIIYCERSVEKKFTVYRTFNEDEI